jgi:hypothetical protein
MAGRSVFIGCKLPNGIILEHPANKAHKVELKGVSNVLVIGADYATTEIDADFWEAWEVKNKDYAPLKSGAIFAAKSGGEVAAIAKDFSARKTGLEPIVPKSHGVEPATAG